VPPSYWSGRLPDFPWDALAPCAERARAHPGGIVDLSIGAPVDPTPPLIQRALADAANAPGYPTAAGIEAVREAAASWLAARHGVLGLGIDAVAPTIGSKELVAWLPLMLGIGPGDVVAVPRLAYPTYDVGVRLAGARMHAADDVAEFGAQAPRLIWVNSPSNPTGAVRPVRQLAGILAWARDHDAVVASDECYLDLGFEASPVSMLHPSVCGDTHANLLSLHSLSKRSNLAGYRAGFVAGDPSLVASIVTVRKHAGLLVPQPVQAAMIAAYGDETHVDEQHARYAARRARLRNALTQAGFRVDHSGAGLYLWVSRGEDCWTTTKALAELGILVAPGSFYGPDGAEHVRIGLTASDERIGAACERLTA